MEMGMSRYFFSVPKDATWPPSKEDAESKEQSTEQGKEKGADNESAD